MKSNENITLVENAIHNPNESRHFMTINQVDSEYMVQIKGVEIGRSNKVLVLKEVGKEIYTPRLYFPRKDINLSFLVKEEGTTFCPLKGDASYYSFEGEKVAWSYEKTFDFCSQIKEYLSFDLSLVKINEIKES